MLCNRNWYSIVNQLYVKKKEKKKKRSLLEDSLSLTRDFLEAPFLFGLGGFSKRRVEDMLPNVTEDDTSFLFCLFRAASAAYGGSQARVESELQLLAYVTATAMPDPSCVCDLCCSGNAGSLTP